jgi:uncharacterized protein YbjT (DUF2867 family)
MILITQATTALGRELVRRLVVRGQSVRVLAADPAALRGIEGPLVDVVRGDLSDRRALAAALAGVGRVLLASSATPEALAARRLAIEAIRRAGVRTVVHLSLLGAARASPNEIAREHASVERQLQASGVDWVHLRPHLFMQTLRALVSTVGNDGRLPVPIGQTRLWPIDARDVGHAAAVCLLDASHAGRSYDLAGPEGLTPREIAERLSRALGRRIELYETSAAVAERRWREGGLGEELAREASALLEISVLAGRAERQTPLELLTGKGPRTLSEFLTEHFPPQRELRA